MNGRPASILPELVSGRGTARRSRVVEGQARNGLGNDPSYRCVRIFKKIGGRDSQSLDSRDTQPIVSHPVPNWTIASGMRFTVNLDRKPGIAAKEVENLDVRRMLTAKLEAVRTLSRPMPQDDFGQSHSTPKLARFRRRARFRFRCYVPQHGPSTVLRTVPLPETSSGRI